MNPTQTELLKRAATPDGALPADFRDKRVRKFAAEFVLQGALVEASIPGRAAGTRRYFTTEELAAAWVQRTRESIAARDAEVRQQTAERNAARYLERRKTAKPHKRPKPAAWSSVVASPKSVAKKSKTLPASAEVIVPANVKRTVAPCRTFDPRYQVDPSTRVLGGFATLGVGRYLEGVMA